MRNIEIKARLKSIKDAETIAAALAGQGAPLRQVDTYFDVPDGRLKLREESGGAAESRLIFYRRADEAGPKRSEYEIAEVENPKELKHVLASAFGIKTVVKKERTVFLYRSARIHLDRVDGLGDFIEFEVVMDEGAPDEEGEAFARELVEKFSIGEGDLVEKSYCDLMKNN